MPCRGKRLCHWSRTGNVAEQTVAVEGESSLAYRLGYRRVDIDAHCNPRRRATGARKCDNVVKVRTIWRCNFTISSGTDRPVPRATTALVNTTWRANGGQS